MPGPVPDPSPDLASSTPGAPKWGDTDLGLPAQPSATFATNPPMGGADQMPTIGHIGRYALKYRIGEGGLGVVYAAHDPLLSRLIAIKTLNLEISAEQRDSFNALFLNEARAAGGLSHPHIVTVFDAGASEQGAYIAMELLKGRDLRQLRLEGWRPTPHQAALIVRRVADALAYAHSKGVVHRDIKPANIFMVGRTQPRVLDFGIARIAHQHDSNGEDIVGGSPYYMSPEQVRQEPVDRRCDVFSLGVVLYELLADVRPFRGSSLAEITRAVAEYNPPTAHQVDANVPKALSEIAARAMEKNPDDRYRSARALSRELRHWLEEHPQDGDGADDAGSQPAGRHRLAWGLVVAAGIGIAAAAWWTLMSPRSGELTASAPPAASAVVVAVAPALVPASAAASEPVATAASQPAPGASTPESPASGVPATPSAGASAPLVVAAAALPVAAATTPEPVLAAASGADTSRKPLPPKETLKERRAREARERAAAAAPVVVATGVVRLAISPWGQVEVDGKSVGTAPPLNELTLAEGRHVVTIRNDDFPPYSSTVNVVPGQPVNLKYRFGS
ncbi:serine/threonine-protein kinase [Rhizobacter sp. SG703]|uniref:serine/threonine-protein kinase n=1 Tax=Rhizobacter sp. SG703 TaxID=2587140 RepID=UPI0017911018|nr:serine/threonine-protein kinase [Rhizobacter sp. SG703]NKI96906.1 serine/threonine-protein kinase [Rhizobacter sp. SG703]